MSDYDSVPYESVPFPDTHPRRLAVLGRIFGLEPADPERCRVLELGCADGGNLIPMAVSLAFGVLFSTFIILVLVPCLYAIQEDLKVFVRRRLGQRADLAPSADSVP